MAMSKLCRKTISVARCTTFSLERIRVGIKVDPAVVYRIDGSSWLGESEVVLGERRNSMSLLDTVVMGLQQVAADQAMKEAALAHLRDWLTLPEFAPYRPQLEWLIQEKKWAGLLDRFYQVLPFGTGGRRGPVGIGPNRMNPWTLGASVQGHCDYLRQRFSGVARLRVAVAYDVRRFEDRQGQYNRTLPNPLLGLTSRDLARHAAAVYVANGIEVVFLPPDSPRYLATPELSYVIREMKCHGGLNVSASHNPPDDNGGKFYDERGAQPVPPDDQIMSDLVDQVRQIRVLEWTEAVQSGRILWLDDSIHRGYIELCRKQSLVAPPKFDEIDVVFTPLHGVGSMTAMEVLEQAGFRPVGVAEQMTPDGQFPNVTQSPNPEVPVAFDRAIALARERQSDLVLATDPDADRIGAVVRQKAEPPQDYRFLSGNEICALLTYFKLERLTAEGRLPPSPIVVVTEVTTRLVTRIAESFAAQVINDLPVGLKYIADVLRQLEDHGRYEEVIGTPADFIIGGEESHGILAMPQLRDKDAASAALLLAELALDCKRFGRTVPEYLEELYRRYGYFRNELRNLYLTGLEGRQQMLRMMESLRRDPPTAIADLPVRGLEDWQDERGRFGPLKGATDAASRNVLAFSLGESARIIIRPSGTEPKAKVYVEVSTPPKARSQDVSTWSEQCRQVDLQAACLADAFVQQAIGRAKS
jgi:phosphoglucomutase/phosphomannomutase